jgi:hypothetical protein
MHDAAPHRSGCDQGSEGAIFVLDSLFTIAVMGALIAMDALGVLPATDAMTALGAFKPQARAK